MANIKLVLWGPSGSGKTSFLKILFALKKHESPDAVAKIMTLKDEETDKTIAFDYAQLGWPESAPERIRNLKLHIFTVPGRERFKAMRKVVSEGLNGLLIILKSDKSDFNANKESLKELTKIVEDFSIPYYVGLNNFGGKDQLQPKEIADVLVEVGISKNSMEAMEKIVWVDTLKAAQELLGQLKAKKKGSDLRSPAVDQLTLPVRNLVLEIARG